MHIHCLCSHLSNNNQQKIMELVTLNDLFIEGVLFDKKKLKAYYLSEIKENETFWEASDKMNAFISCRMDGARTMMPLMFPVTDTMNLLDKNVSFIVVSSTVHPDFEEYMENLTTNEKIQFWFKSRDFKNAMDRTARRGKIDEQLPAIPNAFPGEVAYHREVIKTSVNFFRKHLPTAVIGGFIFKPLGIVVFAEDCRDCVSFLFKERRTVVDVGKTLYSKLNTSKMFIKKGTAINRMIYDDPFSLPKILQNLIPVQLYHNNMINGQLKKAQKQQTGEFTGQVKIRANEDVIIETIVIQWNPDNDVKNKDYEREIYRCIDLVYQNRYASFLFVNAVLPAKDKNADYDIDYSENMRTRKMMFSLSGEQRITVGEDVLNGDQSIQRLFSVTIDKKAIEATKKK